MLIPRKPFALLLLPLLLAACSDEHDEVHPHKPARMTASASAAPAAARLDPQCSEVFTGNHSMVYDKDQLTISKGKCKEFTVVVRNIGHLPRHSRGHNFVISKDTDEKGILEDGTPYGAKANFLKPNDPRILANTTLAGGGEEQRVTFSTDRFTVGGNYVYFCSFLGHHKMRGKVNIVD